MSQVSLPMRIALGATLVFAAIWLVALRPKPPAQSSSTPPAAAESSAESGPGKAAEQATKAVSGQQEAAAAREQATEQVGESESASGPATRPAQAAEQEAGKGTGSVDVDADVKGSGAAKEVLTDLVRGKVAVLLFWDRRLSDDRAVHSAVMGLDRRGGKVAVHVAPIRELADYEPITRGVPVVTSPTVLVIDRAGRARSVGGLTVPNELEELVGKALRVKP